MYLRALLLIGCSAFMAGCWLKPETKAQAFVPMSQDIKQVRQTPHFTRIMVDGRINVVLRTGRSHPQLILHGSSLDIAQLKTTVTNGTLHLTLNKVYPKFGRIQVEIDNPYLTGFEYHGMGEIIGHQLRTRLLDLNIDNKGRTLLEGQIDLRRLIINGNGYTEILGIYSPHLVIKLTGKSKVKLGGKVNLSALEISKDCALSLYWIQSEGLTIRAKDNALIQLAGVAQHLDVELFGKAQFKGRYLRAERAFVKTHQQSIAEISAVARQHALAKDDSDIQFFNLPVMKADFMSNNGAVLDLRHLGSPFIQELSRYNQ